MVVLRALPGGLQGAAWTHERKEGIMEWEGQHGISCEVVGGLWLETTTFTSQKNPSQVIHLDKGHPTQDVHEAQKVPGHSLYPLQLTSWLVPKYHACLSSLMAFSCGTFCSISHPHIPNVDILPWLM